MRDYYKKGCHIGLGSDFQTPVKYAKKTEGVQIYKKFDNLH